MASSPGSNLTARDGRPYHAHVDRGDVEAASVSVVEAIATVEGVDPAEVDFQLGDHADPDALDGLYRHAAARSDASWSLTIDVDEYVVTIRSDGRITIE